MSRKFLFVLLAILLVACTQATPAPVSTPSTLQLDEEEPAVYAALLQEMYSAASYVLMDTTATDPGGVSDTAATLERVLQNMRAVDPLTADSFSLRNDAAHTLRADMDLGASYVLLSQAEMNNIFGQNRDGWQFFYNQYPDAPGIITLSRVGFNDAFYQALVYIGTMSHYLAGAGYFVLLKKVNGVWIVDQQVMTWIS
jgi:hypothetical protein